jgi:hypothetical protein
MTLWLLWVAPALVAAGVFILGRAGLEGLVDLGRALRRRLRGRTALILAWAMRRGESAPEGQTSPNARQALRFPALWAGLGAGLALAALWRHPLLSPWFAALGGAAGWMLVSTRPALRRENLRELETFVSALRSIFSVGQSVFASLAAAAGDLEAGPLRDTVLEAARRYDADLDAGAALATLRGAGWPHLARLALILEQVARADEATLRETLLGLETRVRRARQLQDRAQTVLTLTRLTLRVLQAANLAALTAAATLPTWRSFYTAQPFVLIAATAMALGGSWYFAVEIRRMEDLL